LFRKQPEAPVSIPEKPLPFLATGREDLIEFHILNRLGDLPDRRCTRRPD
jgi:hypothetical protein